MRIRGFASLIALVFVASTSALTAGALADDVLVLNGAGATFPYPIYSKWFSVFHKLDAQVEINYQSIGSGGGIRQLLDRTVDFGASDAPMSDEELAKSQTPIIHIPTVLGAVVATYNVPGVEKSINLSSEVLADIFLGKITKWDDAKIVKDNAGTQFPASPILVVYRSDGSGTTSVFTDYLAKASPEWKSKVGAGKSVKWPSGLGGKGNEGVSGQVKQTPGAIGYVELIYAEQNKMSVAKIKNKAGQFIAPSSKSVTAAANASLKSIPKDFRVSIADADGKDSYPISSFTYLLIYSKMEAKKGKALAKFVDWAMADGQKMAESMSYAPLPKSLITQVNARMKDLKTE